MSEFKPYRYHGCIIYTGKNKKFLEGLAEALESAPLSDKQKMNMKTVSVGGVNYLVLFQNNKIYVTSKSATTRTRSSIYLAEE